MKNHLGNIKECKTLIKHGHVIVNGETVKDPQLLVNSNDEIFVNHQEVISQPFVYYMLNKPKGYICANHDASYPCVMDFIDRDDCVCVGRLDRDTTGLLLISNDKSLIKSLLLPQNHQPKTYLVKTLFPIDSSYVDKFREGICIDRDVRCLPARLEIIDSYHCYVTLIEGKYHQVKKMFLSCQNQVVDLKRVSFANIQLDEALKEGEFRELTLSEFQKMKELMIE